MKKVVDVAVGEMSKQIEKVEQQEAKEQRRRKEEEQKKKIG